MLVGLTGLSCCGKNYIAALLEKRGAAVLDVDKLGHIALEEQKEKIIERWGSGVLDSDKKISRKILADIVFSDPKEIAALEDIVHPMANTLTDKWISENKNKICIINAALLHKSSAFSRLDYMIIVRAPFLIRLLRAKKRDGISFLQILRRFKNQKKFFTQYFKKNADISIIDNIGMGVSSHFFNYKLEKKLDILQGCLENMNRREQ
jgi:dephospho-CoA kinase